MIRILFVDDEPQVIESLKHMLQPMKDEWDMHFLQSGLAALDFMKAHPVDLLISDMNMPGMDGLQLFNKVMHLYPNVARIAFSGQSDVDVLIRSVLPVHQFLAKPSDSETIKSTIYRVQYIRDILDDQNIQQLISRMDKLPSMPSLYTEIVHVLQTPHASLRSVGEIISRDIGMTAQILKLVNSSFFGLGRKVSNPLEAVNYLGLETVKSLVLTVGIFTSYTSEGRLLERIWDHSINMGFLAKSLTKKLNCHQQVAENVMTAALLHDVGKLILATQLKTDYEFIINKADLEDAPVWMIEKDILNVTHAEIGAYLLGLWGFQDSIVEAVALHHYPDKFSIDFLNELTVVHSANAVQNSFVDETPLEVSKDLSLPYLKRLGIWDVIKDWSDTLVNFRKNEAEVRH